MYETRPLGDLFLIITNNLRPDSGPFLQKRNDDNLR